MENTGTGFENELNQLDSLIAEMDYLLNEGAIMNDADKEQFEQKIRLLTNIIKSFDF